MADTDQTPAPLEKGLLMDLRALLTFIELAPEEGIYNLTPKHFKGPDGETGQLQVSAGVANGGNIQFQLLVVLDPPADDEKLAEYRRKILPALIGPILEKVFKPGKIAYDSDLNMPKSADHAVWAKMLDEATNVTGTIVSLQMRKLSDLLDAVIKRQNAIGEVGEPYHRVATPEVPVDGTPSLIEMVEEKRLREELGPLAEHIAPIDPLKLGDYSPLADNDFALMPGEEMVDYLQVRRKLLGEEHLRLPEGANPGARPESLKFIDLVSKPRDRRAAPLQESKPYLPVLLRDIKAVLEYERDHPGNEDTKNLSPEYISAMQDRNTRLQVGSYSDGNNIVLPIQMHIDGEQAGVGELLKSYRQRFIPDDIRRVFTEGGAFKFEDVSVDLRGTERVPKPFRANKAVISRGYDPESGLNVNNLVIDRSKLDAAIASLDKVERQQAAAFAAVGPAGEIQVGEGGDLMAILAAEAQGSWQDLAIDIPGSGQGGRTGGGK